MILSVGLQPRPVPRRPKTAAPRSVPKVATGAVTTPSGHKAVDCMDDSMLELCRALVLDTACRPVTVVGWKRALCLDILEKAEVLEYYDISVRSVSRSHPLPAVLRASFVMKNYPLLKIPFSKRNILVRDGHKCAYCGSKKCLTVDHVVPLSRGGGNDWGNVVTACIECNCEKGNRTLSELGWKLKQAPKPPSMSNMKYKKGLTKGLPLLKNSEWMDYAQGMVNFNV